MTRIEKRSDGQTISRALTILRFLSENPGASFGQIAKATDLPRSTVQRLIGVLNQEGLVTKAFGQQGAYLGMELARLGAKVRLDARSLLKPFMSELHEKVGDNIDLTTIERGQVFVIEQFASHAAIRVISYVGMQHPIHCTANGRAHLSMLPEVEALKLIGETPKAYTPKTETDPSKIMERVHTNAAQGFFVDDEEYDIGASAVAVALPQIGGKDFAVSVAMPTERMGRRREEIVAALLTVKERVLSEYGASI